MDINNSLAALIPVEEKSDGVYIKISPKIKDSIKAEQIFKALREANITNFDEDAIRSIIERASDTFEKIAATISFCPDKQRYIKVDVVNSLKALVKIDSSCRSDGVGITESDLLNYLSQRGIVFGVKTDIIKKIIDEELFDTEHVIAAGEAPVDGQDASISLEIQINPDVHPLITEDGSVDYRSIQTFTQVSRGQILAKRIPPTPGIAGRSVYGKEIAPHPGKDVKLPKGENTFISDDGTALIAGKSGYVYQRGNLIHVSDTLQISGNVDFSVGNIKFSGNVTIMGNVLPGFIVEAEGNVLINGEIESARIVSRNGSVIIVKGVIGKGNSYIYGKSSIHVSFAQDAELVTDGFLKIDKYCLHCTCTCSVLNAAERHSIVLGGHVKAFKYVEVYQAGNENGVLTHISLVDKKKMETAEKLKELQALRGKVLKELEPIKRELKSKAHIIKNMEGNLSEKNKEVLQKLVLEYNSLNNKLEYIDKNIEKLLELMKRPSLSDGYIKVVGDVFAGVDLDFYGIIHKIKSRMSNKIFKLADGEIQS